MGDGVAAAATPSPLPSETPRPCGPPASVPALSLSLDTATSGLSGDVVEISLRSNLGFEMLRHVWIVPERGSVFEIPFGGSDVSSSMRAGSKTYMLHLSAPHYRFRSAGPDVSYRVVVSYEDLAWKYTNCPLIKRDAIGSIVVR